MINYFSRKVWIYILKNKSQTFQTFKEWNTLVENQIRTKLLTMFRSLFQINLMSFLRNRELRGIKRWQGYIIQ